jgi:hypothetical protein
MVDTLEHNLLPASKDRLFTPGFASLREHC